MSLILDGTAGITGPAGAERNHRPLDRPYRGTGSQMIWLIAFLTKNAALEAK